jgi:hypothetical protein
MTNNGYVLYFDPQITQIKQMTVYSDLGEGLIHMFHRLVGFQKDNLLKANNSSVWVAPTCMKILEAEVFNDTTNNR